jgi:hypothetical protein
VLLGVDTDGKARLVHQLLANADVALLDKNTGVVHGLGKTLLEYLGLETALEDLLGGKQKNGIQLLLVFAEEAEASELAKESRTFKKALGVLHVKSHQLTSSL